MAHLEFIVLKINNTDTKHMEKSDAVHLFLSSNDPIILEVQRKISVDLGEMSEEMKVLNFCENNPNGEIHRKPNDRVVMCIKSTKVTQGTQTETDGSFSLEQIENENVAKIVEEEHNIFEQCLEQEIDVEEITLRKSSSNEHLGLTVCYSPICGNTFNNNTNVKIPEDVDHCAEVYISDIQPESVAGRDGRLRPGDQILQINGKDVKSKEDTEALIAENSNAVTLLVSRYMFGEDDFFNDHCLAVEDSNDNNEGDDYDDDANSEHFDEPAYISYQNSFLDNNSVILSADFDFINNMNECKDDANVVIIDNNWKKRTLFPNWINSIVSNKFDDKLVQSKKSPECLKKSLHPDGERFKEEKSEHLKEFEHIYETIPEFSDTEPFYSSPYEISRVNRNRISSFETASALLESSKSPEQKQRVAQWLGIKNNSTVRSNEKPKLITSSINKIGGNTIIPASSNTSGSTSNISHLICNAGNTKSLSNDDFDNSSSAYNSGGSNNSVVPCNLSALNSLRNQFCNHYKKESSRCAIKENSLVLKKSKQFFASPRTTELMQSKSQIKKQQQSTANFSNEQSKKLFCADSKILNNRIETQNFTAPNLSQYHFVSSQEVGTILNASLLNNKDQTTKEASQEQMVWKVKRRADGSRYIVRRPVRKYLIRERSFPLNVLNCEDTTTEDDTVSEVKLGRYWSKEDRKKHIEKAKERKQQLRNHETSFMRPSLRKSSKLPKNLPNNQNSPPINGLSNLTSDGNSTNFSEVFNQKKFFQLQFNSKDISEKVPKNKEPICLTQSDVTTICSNRSIDCDVENKTCNESSREANKIIGVSTSD